MSLFEHRDILCFINSVDGYRAAAALRRIVDGYRATVGAAIDTDTIDRHRDSADGGEIAARVCAHSQTATGSRRNGRGSLSG